MNKVILYGHLTRDPELKYLQSGVAVCNFGLAMNERWTDAQTGERKEDVTYVDVEAWARQAEVINEHLKKGLKSVLSAQARTPIVIFYRQ